MQRKHKQNKEIIQIEERKEGRAEYWYQSVPVGQRPQQHTQVFLREAAIVKVGKERLRAPFEGRAAVAIPSDAVPLRQLLVGGTHAEEKPQARGNEKRL